MKMKITIVSGVFGVLIAVIGATATITAAIVSNRVSPVAEPSSTPTASGELVSPPAEEEAEPSTPSTSEESADNNRGPRISLSEQKAGRGDTVTFSGSGFSPDEHIWILEKKTTFNKQIVDVTADDNGEFNVDVVLNETIVAAGERLPKRYIFFGSGDSNNRSQEISLQVE